MHRAIFESIGIIVCLLRGLPADTLFMDTAPQQAKLVAAPLGPAALFYSGKQLPLL